MGKFPGAVWRPVTRYQSGSRHVSMRPRRLILHTAVSSATTMHSYFNVDGRATSHFYVGPGGEGEQYIDTSYISSANLEGNHDCITVESWDGYPSTFRNGQPPAWTDDQVEWLAQLAEWCNREHGIPLVQLPSSKPGTTGIGWHRQGIDGNYPSGLLSGRVSGGERWSTSDGKACPGDARIQQIPALIIPRAIEISQGDDVMQESDFKEIRAIVENAVAPLRKEQADMRQALATMRENTVKRDKDLQATLDKLAGK